MKIYCLTCPEIGFHSQWYALKGFTEAIKNRVRPCLTLNLVTKKVGFGKWLLTFLGV